MPNVSEIFWVKSERTVSKFRKRKRNFLCCAHLLHKIKWNRTFHVAVLQQRLRNVQKSVMHVQSWFFANLNLFFCCSPSPLQKLPIVVIQKFCYHGNVTSHFSSPETKLVQSRWLYIGLFLVLRICWYRFRKTKKRTYPISILTSLLVNNAYINLIAITFYYNQGCQTKEWTENISGHLSFA